MIVKTLKCGKSHPSCDSHNCVKAVMRNQQQVTNHQNSNQKGKYSETASLCQSSETPHTQPRSTTQTATHCVQGVTARGRLISVMALSHELSLDLISMRFTYTQYLAHRIEVNLLYRAIAPPVAVLTITDEVVNCLQGKK